MCSLLCKCVFPTIKHEKTFSEKVQEIHRGKGQYAYLATKSKAAFSKKVSRSKNRAIDGSYKIAESIVKHGDSFTDERFLKEGFLSASDMLFVDLLTKSPSSGGLRMCLCEPAQLRDAMCTWLQTYKSSKVLHYNLQTFSAELEMKVFI